jgi:hypothetical protein
MADMADDTETRTTTGVVDRIEPNGVIFVHEESSSRKLGFLEDDTPVKGPVRRGTRLSLDVRDRGNVMVVLAARVIITAEQFRHATGRDPVGDDLERVNCSKAGDLGHWFCGWDDMANLPRFLSSSQHIVVDKPVEKD